MHLGTEKSWVVEAEGRGVRSVPAQALHGAAKMEDGKQQHLQSEPSTKPPRNNHR